MKRFIVFLSTIIGCISFGVLPSANATPPPDGYPTDEVLWTVNTSHGNIPLRRGFYDSDAVNPYPNVTGENTTGVGFGMDKVYHKHNITNSDLVKLVMSSTEGRLKLPDNPTVVNFRRSVTFMFCVPSSTGPMCFPDEDKNPTYDILVAAELDNFPDYFGWPAGDPVGVLTAYCVNHDGWCPPNVNSPIMSDLVGDLIA